MRNAPLKPPRKAVNKERSTCAGPEGPYCKGMVLAITPSSGLHQFISITRGTLGIAIKTGPHKHFLLNTCPWCSKNIIKDDEPVPRKVIGPKRTTHTRDRVACSTCGACYPRMYSYEGPYRMVEGVSKPRQFCDKHCYKQFVT